MIELSINGKQQQFTGPLTVTQLVYQLALVGKRVAIERNGEIVPRSQFDQTPLCHGDQLEIVVAVGGG
ncbi:MAG: sulfur carrier protein ThiS [Sulfurimicrobium sp.]|nr:sulfur carrier protein ThiS [Sulfurimicrobium sp.]MDP1705874.1 sulfur carrier protein ThiS [Sulfurimicrobium sp.]MDP1898511.1 sulfur carrier protein ThiS [Sulfurimicrobium sp.]MDP2199593.1 sulfur carrier protein ThiS [Sulfurimicrobium sp.]MDP3689332.1 sulfur carrier protein ThiS [Sulfurimicrobium sp.]